MHKFKIISHKTINTQCSSIAQKLFVHPFGFVPPLHINLMLFSVEVKVVKYNLQHAFDIACMHRSNCKDCTSLISMHSETWSPEWLIRDHQYVSPSTKWQPSNRWENRLQLHHCNPFQIPTLAANRIWKSISHLCCYVSSSSFRSKIESFQVKPKQETEVGRAINYHFGIGDLFRRVLLCFIGDAFSMSR